MENNFEIKDTTTIQCKSLANFADQLGYWFHIDGYFVSEASYEWCQYSDKNIISYKTMVMLHNEGNLDNHGKVYERFGFDLYTWEKAKGAKIVHHVNLTANKKKKSIHCHKHLVKFVKPYYKEMFLK